MPDIFDQLAPDAPAGGGDIFDHVASAPAAPAAPKPDIFDELTAPRAPLPPSRGPAVPAGVVPLGGGLDSDVFYDDSRRNVFTGEQRPEGAGAAETAKNLPAKIGAGLLRAGAGLHNVLARTPGASGGLSGMPLPPAVFDASARTQRSVAKELVAGQRPPGTAAAQVIDEIGTAAANVGPTLVAGAVGGPPLASLVSGAQSLGNMEDRVSEAAIAKGATEQQAHDIAHAPALAAGGIGAVSSGILSGGSPAAQPLAQRLTGQAIEGAAYGAVQTGGEEFVASRATGDAPVWSQVPVGAGVGGAINVGMTLLGEVVTRGRARIRPQVRQQLEQRIQAAQTPQEVQRVVADAEALSHVVDDTPAAGAAQGGDIFDQVAAESGAPEPTVTTAEQQSPALSPPETPAQPSAASDAPRGDVFDQIAPDAGESAPTVTENVTIPPQETPRDTDRSGNEVPQVAEQVPPVAKDDAAAARPDAQVAPEVTAPRAKGAPLPLPPMHEDVHPPSVQRAWDMISARYPRIAALVKRIEPLDTYRYGFDKNAQYDASTGTLRVNIDQPLRPSTLAHEFTHAAQVARGNPTNRSDFHTEEGFQRAVEDPAYRRGKAFDVFDQIAPDVVAPAQQRSPEPSASTDGSAQVGQSAPGVSVAGAGESVPPPVAPVKQKPAKTPFTRASIERRLIQAHEEQGGGYTPADESQLSEIHQPFTFADKLPGEIKRHIENNPAARRLFRVTSDPTAAGGADALGKLGDRYFQIVDKIAGSNLKQAKETARKSGDPKLTFWSAVHDNLPPAKERPAQIGVDPATLNVGQEFELNGSKFQVIEDEDGYRMLKDGNDYPETPVDALAGEKIPVDKGTLHQGEEPAVPEGDPFADVREEKGGRAGRTDTPAVLASADQGSVLPPGNSPAMLTPSTGRHGDESVPRPPEASLPAAFFDADSAGLTPRTQGIFGQEVLDNATGNKTGGLFHEPNEAKPVAGEKLRASAGALDPKNTGSMFDSALPAARDAGTLAPDEVQPSKPGPVAEGVAEGAKGAEAEAPPAPAPVTRRPPPEMFRASGPELRQMAEGNGPNAEAAKTELARRGAKRGGDSPPAREAAPPPPAAEPVTPKPAGPDLRVASLRKQAESLTKHIEDKLRDMTQNPTPKRMREYGERRTEGGRLQRVQRALNALADAREAGTLPKDLDGIHTKAAVEKLVARKKKHNGGYYDPAFETDEYTDTSPAGKALQDLIDPRRASPEQAKADAERSRKQRIEDAENKVRFSPIEGFFPTPEPLVTRLMDAAEIEPGMKVLEPSAGKGDIADAAREAGADVETVEINPTLREILEAKGHKVVGEDFMQHGGQYDRIVMNPPFERGQDAQHVQRAWDLLKPGGKIVAVMSEGTFSRSDRKATEFRTWLNERDGTSEKVESGAFTGPGAFRQTGVATRIVTVEKPGATRNSMRPRGAIALPSLPPRTATHGTNFDLTNENTFDAIRRVVQDELLPVKRMQADVARQGGTVRESSDPYLKSELFRGRAANEIRTIERETVRPIVERMTKAGLTVEDVDQYLYAMHAPERNAQVAKVNPAKAGLYADGSGMSDADAARVIAKFQADGKVPDLDAIATLVHQMNDATLQRQVDAGLLEPDAAKAMRQTYQKYVPLRTDMEADGMSNSRPGKGFSVRGKEGHRATGRESIADSPLTFSIMQAQEKVVRAEKNRVGQSLLKFVRDNPDPDLWAVNKHPTTKIVDPNTGVVREQVDPLFQYADNVVPVKENGKTHLIEFKGEAGARIAAAVKRLDYQDGGRIVQTMGKAMRVYASMQTTLNPDFIVPNLIRDVQAAAINLSAEQSAGMAGRLVKGLNKSRKAMWDVAADPTAKPGSEYHDYAREYTAAGGRVDSYRLASYEQTGKQISSLLGDANPTGGKRLLLAAKRAGEFVDRLSGSLEQATRLSAYVEARKSGMSAERAASLAKNLTVNFERKGSAGTFINSLYLFANANIQGNARMISALATSRRGRKIAAGIAASGLAYGVLTPLMFGKDDEGRDVYDTIPEQIRATNLVLPTGGGKYVKLPMPYGYNAIFSAGRLLGEAATGRTRPASAAATLITTGIDAFNPLGNEGSLLQTLSPTALDPLVQQAENKDWTGREIVPQQNPFGPPKPDSQLARRDTFALTKAVAQLMNAITGGDEVTSGGVDVSPATIEHYVGWATGGIGRFLFRAGSLPFRVAEGDVPPSTIPLANRFVGEPPRSTNAREFYDILRAGEDAKSDLKHYDQAGKAERADRLRHQHGKDVEFLRWGDRLRSDVKELKDAGKNAEADAKMSGFLKAYRAGELPPRWQFENELGDLRTARARYNTVRKAGDDKAARTILRDNKGFGRLRLLERREEMIRKWDGWAKDGKITQAEADRRAESVLRSTMKKAG